MPRPDSPSPWNDSGFRAGRRVAGFAFALALVGPGGLLAAGIELTGRIFDEAAEPIAGSRIELQRIETRHAAGSRLIAGKLSREAVATTRSRADGRFRLSAPEAGMWQVEITAPGKIPVRRRLIPLTEPRELPPAVLVEDGGAWVTVVDGADQPVGGALIWWRPASEKARRGEGRDWRARGRLALTDEAGTAYLSRRRGRSIQLFAYAPGFLASEGLLTAGDRARVVLESGRALPMRFLTADGAPAAHAVVGIGELQWASTRTDGEGRATLFVRTDEPLPFSLLLTDGQRESGTLQATAEELDELAADAERFETMTLPRPSVIAGRVLDAQSRRAAVGAWVWSAADPGRVERAGPEGDYRLVESSTGTWQIGAVAPGYQPARAQPRAEGTGSSGPTIALRRTAVLAGRVVTGESEAVNEAVVVATEIDESPYRPGTSFRATSDDEGSFRLAGVVLGAGYDLVVEAEGFAPARVAARADGGSEIEVVLERGLAVTGRTVDEDGAALADVDLVAGVDPSRWFDRRGNLPGEPATTRSREDGTFRLEGLSGDHSLLVARKTGYSPKQVPLVEFIADSAGRPVDLGEVVLRTGAEIQGRVIDEDEGSVVGARVQVITTGLRSAGFFASLGVEPVAATSDAEGRFILGGLTVGEPLSLLVEHADFLRQGVDNLVAGEEEEIEIVLERGARIEGRVVDQGNRPVGGLSVEARPLGNRQGGLTPAFGDASRGDGALSERDGSFTLSRVAPGVVELAASGAGFVAAAAVELELAPGETREGVVLRVERGRVVEGTVRDVEQRPVARAVVQVNEPRADLAIARQRAVVTAVTDADGAYRLEGLDPGHKVVDLGVHHPQFLSAERRLELVAGVSRLDVVLERGLTVDGVVWTPEGEPAPGASVGLDGGGGVYFGGRNTALSDSQGRFEITGVAPGSYRLFALKEGYARTTRTEPLVVGERSISGLSLTLTRGGTIRGRILGLEPGELAGLTVMATDRAIQTALGVVGDDARYVVSQVGFDEGMIMAFSQTTGRNVSEPFALTGEEADAIVDLEFERDPGSTLGGLVLLDGEAWSGVQVVARGGFASQGNATTDAAGRFEIRGLADGVHEVVLFGGSVVSHSETVEVVGDTRLTIEVGTVTVRGRVVTADTAEPVAGAVVTVEGVAPAWLGALAARAETSSLGSFELVLPARRQVVLRARAPGRSEATLPLETGSAPLIDGLVIELAAGGEIRVDLRLSSGLPPSWVAARVVDANGRPVAEATRTGAISMPLQIPSVPAGSWRLYVAAEGGATVSVPVEVPGPTVSLTLPPEARLAVDVTQLAGELGSAGLRLLDPGGVPVPLAAFGRLLDSWPVLSAVTEIPSLPAGQWILEVVGTGGVRRQAVTTVAGTTTSVVLE